MDRTEQPGEAGGWGWGGQWHFPEDSADPAQGARLMDLDQDVTGRPEEP